MNRSNARCRIQDQMAMPAMVGVGFDWRYRKSFCLEDLKIMDNMERLGANSRRLRKVFIVLLVSSPVLTALFWFIAGMGNQTVTHNLPVTVDPDVPTHVFVLCFLVSMIPTGVVMYAFYQLIKLLGLYGQGMVFGRENVIAIRTLGKTIIAWEIANFITSTALGLLLTMHRGVGNRMLVVGVDNSDIYALVAGFSVLTVAWVMDEARKIKEDQELII